ncbi:hypothetical protein G5I_03904 [Acromyrmex echinatior]|uniref:Uncharacterized protein n=1 Tax=Acromyrmex echinatior TaxID=103372 RepID=F4WE73_ACREC|nr:hypothetical protein G5I_03904 [Acromyrmex echinatior]
MILVHTIVDHDDRLRLRSPAFSILPQILWRSGQGEFICAEILLRDMQRYTIAVPAKVIESDIHERSNELASLAARGVFRVSDGKVSNKKGNEFLGQLSHVRPKKHEAPHRLDRSIVSLAAAE